MGKLSDIWDAADAVLSEIGDWFYDIRHRKQKFQVTDDHGVSTFYAPKEIPPEDWQKLIRDKIGGETQNVLDVSRHHTACLLYFIDLVENEKMGVEEAFANVQSEDIDIKKYVPAFMLPAYGIYPEKMESSPELPKP